VADEVKDSTKGWIDWFDVTGSPSFTHPQKLSQRTGDALSQTIFVDEDSWHCELRITLVLRSRLQQNGSFAVAF
jgi:hypothetical protein